MNLTEMFSFKDGEATNEYQFVSEVYTNSSGWGHVTHLFRNGGEIATKRIKYYNRTWERYQFESVMQSCITDQIDSEWSWYIKDFKSKNHIRSLAGKRKGDARTEFDKQAIIRELRQLYTIIGERRG